MKYVESCITNNNLCSNCIKFNCAYRTCVKGRQSALKKGAERFV